MDYPKMARAMLPLQEWMSRTDRFQLKLPGTDLRFSIKGIGAIRAEGLRKIADGVAFQLPDQGLRAGLHLPQHPHHLFGHEV